MFQINSLNNKIIINQFILIITIYSYLILQLTLAWAPDVPANLRITNYDMNKVIVFYGNRSDYFKILDQDENTILIGAKNSIYNLTLNGLTENHKYRIEWMSSDADRELCALKGKLEQDCQNYIRVFGKINDNQIVICGTNSYKPRCRYYNYNGGGQLAAGSISSSSDETLPLKPYEFLKEVEAQGRCPYNPQHNSTYIYTDGKLYSATVADFSGADPLIFRETLRTEQYDLKQLNQPAFISSVEYNGYVFFFFREIAMEYMNCGKAIYSRVGRVCKNDRGGPYAFSDRWTSFLKTRLNCSVPGEYPFYFDEIQATSKIIEAVAANNQNNNQSSSAVIYAVFTTSINAIPGSAVCAFSIDDILDAFDGRFKFQKDTHSNWLPFPADRVPEPRPGRCVDDSRTLSSTAANFVKTHTLMEQSVRPLYNRPLLTRVNLSYRLTAIAVDPQILAMDNNTYDVIFAGTDDGRIIKFMNVPKNDYDDGIQTVVIAEIQALLFGNAVRELTISRRTESLIVVGDVHIVSIPLHHCSNITDCDSCLKVQDPYCAWDINNHECKSIGGSPPAQGAAQKLNSEQYIQELHSMENIKRLCKKFSDIGNRINPIVVPYTRGIVSGVGKNRNAAENSAAGGTANTGFAAANSNSNTIQQHDKITLTSISPNDIHLRNFDPDLATEFEVQEEQRLLIAAASQNNVYWSFFVILPIVIVFLIGIFVGWYMSKRMCQNSQFFHSSSGTDSHHQRNHLKRHLPFNSRGGGGGICGIGGGGGGNSKDVNLLMNTSNAFATQQQQQQLQQQQNNNKQKDLNLEHEFAVIVGGVGGVGDKDRSHECKNSTENLDKELNCSKTGTLTKVKRTYI